MSTPIQQDELSPDDPIFYAPPKWRTGEEAKFRNLQVLPVGQPVMMVCPLRMLLQNHDGIQEGSSTVACA